jgi:hypothetical protein
MRKNVTAMRGKGSYREVAVIDRYGPDKNMVPQLTR